MMHVKIGKSLVGMTCKTRSDDWRRDEFPGCRRIRRLDLRAQPLGLRVLSMIRQSHTNLMTSHGPWRAKTAGDLMEIFKRPC